MRLLSKLRNKRKLKRCLRNKKKSLTPLRYALPRPNITKKCQSHLNLSKRKRSPRRIRSKRVEIITTITDLMPHVKVVTLRECIQTNISILNLQLKFKPTVSSTLISVTCITTTIIITPKHKRSKKKKT